MSAPALHPRAAGLVVEEVSMIYASPDAGGLHALERVSLELAPGSFCSLVGPSGCGKSTLLMLVAGLYRPSSGRVLIDGREVRSPWHDVGFVFQRDVLLEWRRVLDNVLLPIEVRREPKHGYLTRARDLLGLVGLEGFERYYPDQLSGGMRQRVAICRALIHSPSLLLMDEPFAAVDALTRERLNFDLLRLTDEFPTTVIFVTHSIEEAVLLSDQVLVLGPRPARVVRTFENPLPKPRTVASRGRAEFQGLVQEVRDVFLGMGLL